jgi:hypothetical protein
VTQVFQGESGQYYALRNGRYDPIDEDMARQLTQGPGVAAVGGLIQSTVGTVLGAGELLRSETAAQQRQLLEQRTAGIRENNPVAFGAGAAAPAVIPFGAGLSGLRGAAALGAGGAAFGAAQNPDNPMLGAAIGGAAGAAGVPFGALLSRGVQTARSGADRGVELSQRAIDVVRGRSGAADSVGAARNQSPDFDATTRRPLEGLLTSAEADNLGIALTRGERQALDAGTPQQLARANELRNTEDLLSSTPVRGLGINVAEAADATVGRVTGARLARDEQEAFFTRYVAAELGDPTITNLTPARRGEIRREVQKVFRENIDNNTRPIPADAALDVAEGLAENAGVNSSTRLNSYLEDICTAGANGTFDAEEFSSLRNRISRDTERAFRAGNYELGSGLSQVQEALDSALERVLDGEARAEIRQARTRWGIIKALEGARALNPDGEINIRSFYNAYRANNPGIRTGTRQDEFARVLETMRFLTSRQTNDSGTAARLLANGARNIPLGAVALGVAGGLLGQ